MSSNGTMKQKEQQKPWSKQEATKLSFPVKLWKILQESDGMCISWLPDGKAFKVHSAKQFADEVMKTYFTQNNYKSFTRQLYLYGFLKVVSGSDAGAFYHPCFTRDNQTAAVSIKRNQFTGDRRQSKLRKTNKKTAPKSNSGSSMGQTQSQTQTQMDQRLFQDCQDKNPSFSMPIMKTNDMPSSYQAIRSVSITSDSFDPSIGLGDDISILDDDDSCVFNVMDDSLASGNFFSSPDTFVLASNDSSFTPQMTASQSSQQQKVNFGMDWLQKLELHLQDKSFLPMTTTATTSSNLDELFPRPIEDMMMTISQQQQGFCL